MPKNTISVKHTSQASHDTPKVVMDDVLGRIGRTFLSYPKKQDESKVDKKQIKIPADVDIGIKLLGKLDFLANHHGYCVIREEKK